MPRLPGIGVGLAGLAVFVLALLALVQGQDITLTQPESTPPETTAANGTAGGEQTASEDPDSVVRVQPDKVVIQGKKEKLRDVTYERVPLTVWLSDLSTEGQNTDNKDNSQQKPRVSWSPVSAGDGSVPLTVERITSKENPEGPCEGARSSGKNTNPACYEVGLMHSSRLPAGTYGATIYVGDDPDARRSIPVEVLVGRPLLWLIGIVALGVIATELLVWWREGAYYRRGWQVRRAKWLDWLSENLGWTRPYERYSERKDVERAVLRVVKESLREKVNGIRTWLDRGTKGETTIGQVPANLDAARDLVYPLRLERERYVANPTAWGGSRLDSLDSLERHLSELGNEAVAQSKSDLNKAHEDLPNVHFDPKNRGLATAYKALDEWWKSDPKTVDKKLSEAWVVIRELWKKAEELKPVAPTRPVLPDNATEPADIAGAAEILSGYLSKWKADVFSKAKATLDTLKEIPPAAPGQKETVDFLTKVVSRMTALERAEQAVDRANHPLKFAEPESVVGRRLENIKSDLQAVDGRIDSMSSRNLTEDAVRTTILKPVREQLESTEAKFNDSALEIKQRWLQVRFNYDQNHRFVRLGKKIAKNKKLLQSTREHWTGLLRGSKPETYVRQAEGCLKNAYRFLLDGKALDAEIELERAEDNIQMAYAERGGEATLWDRFSMMEEDLRQSANDVRERAKRMISLVAFNTLIVGVLALVLGAIIWILSGAAAGVSDLLLPDSSSVDGSWPTVHRLVSFISEQPFRVALWAVLIGLFLAILIWAAVQYLRYGRPTNLDGAFSFRERWENIWPFTVRLLLGALSGFLSLIIAVTIILAYQQTVPKEQLATWGTNLDLVVAFALGVLAHRAVQSLSSASEDLMSFLKGEEKPSTSSETATEEKDSAATTPAKPATGTG